MSDVMRVGDRATVVRADNPGLMTLEGTNTWILREPGADRAVVIDPGPLDETHLRAVLGAAGPVAVTLLTHRHPDHTEGAAQFAEMSGAPVRGFDPSLCVGAEPLHDDERLEVDGLRLVIVTTPGHTNDSMCIHVPADSCLLTGDTVLGRGTSVVAHPDGVLGPYLASLAQIRSLIDDEQVARLLPGHGLVIEHPVDVLEFYLAHRQQRLGQVQAAVDAGAQTARAVVEAVYTDVDEALWPAAELSVRAQLDYLQIAP